MTTLVRASLWIIGIYVVLFFTFSIYYGADVYSRLELFSIQIIVLGISLSLLHGFREKMKREMSFSSKAMMFGSIMYLIIVGFSLVIILFSYIGASPCSYGGDTGFLKLCKTPGIPFFVSNLSFTFLLMTFLGLPVFVLSFFAALVSSQTKQKKIDKQ